MASPLSRGWLSGTLRRLVLRGQDGDTDDLAETVVLHLVRGAGLDGVASMARPRVGGVRRPLLGLRRSETEALCADLGLTPIVDVMNSEPRFRRVRVRNEVMPLLADVAGRDVAALLARHAVVTADEVALLDDLSAEIDPAAPWALRDAPPALARRAVRRWLLANRVGDGRSVDAATVDRILSVAAGHSEACDVTIGWRVHRRAGVIRLVAPEP